MINIVDLFYILKRDNYKIMSDSEFSECVRLSLENQRPFMAGRIGATESSVLRVVDFNYKNKTDKMLEQLAQWSGFFPKNKDLLPEFARIYEDAIGNCDVLYPMGYRGENYLISRYAMPSIKYYHRYFVNSGDDIWFRHLQNKKVLVIHPFEKTIRSQYEKYREKLHKSPFVLPEFDLYTIKAVFTAADEEDNRFSDWFEALKYMHEESKKIDYDIALISCGAYGLPLASMIKNDGKVAVHMGGVLQLLFGIKGARWERKGGLSEGLYNEYWTYADKSERPTKFFTIEGSSYWEPSGK